ncbi:MAG: Uma2 family endonuclease [Chloroflexota bacterium]|nr:Uma2 family endonuclease [Chloroflexota bacterium]
MIDVPLLTETPPLVVKLRPAIDMTEEEFFHLCQINRELRLERTAEGHIVIMTPAGGKTSSRNATLNAMLYSWAKRDGRGVTFDSSGGFTLPNGAMRSPDAAWVLRARLESLPEEQKRRFLPLCPDFVVELRSPTDRVSDLQDKMEEYVANGARLGWLLVPETHDVYIYHPNSPATHLHDPDNISGEPVLHDFVLHLADIWDPGF